MEILTSQLPSGGYNYEFPSLNIKPMTFLEITGYIENVPKDPLDKYLYDIRVLAKDEPRIYDCYLMDLDFLIFYKKLCTVSDGITYEVSLTCPDCGKSIKRRIDITRDIHFKQLDNKVMNGAVINLRGNNYETIVPTVKDFMTVFDRYLRVKKVNDLGLIKTISLINDIHSNQVEEDVLGATGKDITLLKMLGEVYFDRVEPIEVFCPDCNRGLKPEERRSMAVSVDSLIVDFFRDLYINSPIDGTKVLFK